MPSPQSRLSVTLLVALTGLALTSCGSSPSEKAAQAAYNACQNPDAESSLYRLDEDTVSLEIKGQTAKALSNGYDAAENLGATGDLSEEGSAGIGQMFAMAAAVDCLVEETEFPGTWDELRDGDEWDGWRYSEEEGAGSEATFSFTSTL